MVTQKDFIYRFKDRNYLVQHNEQYHREVLLSNFHFIQRLKDYNNTVRYN